MKKGKFNIYLRINSPLKPSLLGRRKKYKDDDEYSFVIADICRVLQNEGCIDFIIEGFPELSNLSCDFDLACAMEELPSVFNKIKANDFNFEILLYEQGTEKEIRFRSSSSENVEILLYDLYGNCIESMVLQSNKKEVAAMLTRLHKDFMNVSYNLCPHLTNNHLMSEFAKLTDGLSFE